MSRCDKSPSSARSTEAPARDAIAMEEAGRAAVRRLARRGAGKSRAGRRHGECVGRTQGQPCDAARGRDPERCCNYWRRCDGSRGRRTARRSAWRDLSHLLELRRVRSECRRRHADVALWQRGERDVALRRRCARSDPSCRRDSTCAGERERARSRRGDSAAWRSSSSARRQRASPSRARSARCMGRGRARRRAGCLRAARPTVIDDRCVALSRCWRVRTARRGARSNGGRVRQERRQFGQPIAASGDPAQARRCADRPRRRALDARARGAELRFRRRRMALLRRGCGRVRRRGLAARLVRDPSCVRRDRLRRRARGAAPLQAHSPRRAGVRRRRRGASRAGRASARRSAGGCPTTTWVLPATRSAPRCAPGCSSTGAANARRRSMPGRFTTASSIPLLRATSVRRAGSASAGRAISAGRAERRSSSLPSSR